MNMNTTTNRSCFTQNLQNTTRTIQSTLWILTAPEESRIIFTVCYSVLLFLAVVGNFCIVLVVCKTRQMQTNINFLIVNMAVSDLAGSLVSIPRMISLATSSSVEWNMSGVFADILCKLCPFIRDVSISVSIESMVAIALDRFFAVFYPLKTMPRLMRLRVVLPFIWIVAMAPFCLHLVTYQMAYFKGKTFCVFIWPSTLERAEVHQVYFIAATMILFFVVPFVIVSVVYSMIVWKMKHRSIPGQQLHCENETRRQKLNSSIVKMALVIVLSFFFCWFPYHILAFFDFFIWKRNPKKSPPSFTGLMREILTFISYVSLAINPFICFAFSSNFRNCLKGLFPFSLFFANNTSSFKLKKQRTNPTHLQEMNTFNNYGLC